MTNKRIAHLIGIGDYHESISSLPVTRRDREALGEILPGSGYEVTKHLCGTSDLGRNGLEDLLIRICAKAPAGAQVLLFFSGHGLHLEGTDYLVPKDARYREAAGFISQLVPASLTGHIRNSRAAAITCILDACRSDFATGHKGLDDPGKSIGSGGDKPAKPGETTLITVYSCKAAEASRFEKADTGLSHFTRALCTVLAHTHPAETVEAVLVAAQDELDRLTAAAKHRSRRSIFGSNRWRPAWMRRPCVCATGRRRRCGMPAKPPRGAGPRGDSWRRRDCSRPPCPRHE